MFGFRFADQRSVPPEDPADPSNIPEAAAPGDERVHVGDEVNDLLMKLLPWGVSFLLHAGLILVSVFLAWTVTSAVNPEDNQGPIIPIATLSATPGAALSMQQGDTPVHSTSAMERPSASSVTTSTSKLFSRSSGGAGTGGGFGPGTGGGHGGGSGAGGMGEGFGGGGLGGGGGGGGKGNPFGSGVGGGSGNFRATFGGTGGNARKLVYLVDASGSLIDTLPFVLRELQRSIGQLSDRQSFAVIFFQGDEAIEVPPFGLKRATADAKLAVIQWVDPKTGNITPMNQSNPIKALQKALSYKPDLMFILSDNITGGGIYEVDQRRLLKDIDDANHAGTKINTIQFLYQDKLEQAGLKGTLELIAKQSGGMYKFLDGKELGIQ